MEELDGIPEEGYQQPSLKYLNRYVRSSVGNKWHDLGIELLDSNSNVGKLNTIETEHSSDLNKCCTKMFNLWLDKQPRASWNQLIEALRQPGIELGTLASKIEQMLLQPKPQGQGSMVIGTDNRHWYNSEDPLPPLQTDRLYNSENVADLSSRHQNHMSESKHSRGGRQPQPTQHMNEPNSVPSTLYYFRDTFQSMNMGDVEPYHSASPANESAGTSFLSTNRGTVANELVFTNQPPLQPDRRNSVNVAELYSRHQRRTAKSNSLSGRKQSQQVQHMMEFHSVPSTWSHRERLRLASMAYTEPHHLVSSANESAGTSSFSRNMYRDRSRVLDDIDIINSPVESMISPSRKELEQQTPSSHYQSQLPFNLNHNTGTSAKQSPAATDPNVLEGIPTQVEETETDDAGIDDASASLSVITTDYQNSVQLQDANVQTAAEKQVNDITTLQRQNESLNQLLQEQQKKIAALEEKVDKISIEQKQHNENFESKISTLQEIYKMKQKDQNKPLNAKDFKY